MKRIPLTEGKYGKKYALIDDEDFEMVNLFKWCASKHGDIFYAITFIKLDNKQGILCMHRLIINAKPNELSDHRDMNGLNNQKYNLRKCNSSQSNMNRRKFKNSYSKYKGVTWHKQNRIWRARIFINKKQLTMGHFREEKDAAMAYNKKAKELFGEFARLNDV